MLRVEGLHAYYGHGHILQGVDLEVEAGRIAAILGRSSCLDPARLEPHIPPDQVERLRE